MGGGSWVNEVHCTRRKDGRFSLRAHKRGDDGAIAPAGMTRIRSPQAFVQALIELVASLNDKIDTAEILDESCRYLERLDSKFAGEIRAYIRSL